MKELYFDDDHMDDKAAEFLGTIAHLRDKRPWAVDFHRAALLVLDMQDYFLSENSHAHIPSMKAIVSKIKRLQHLFLNRHLPVIQTRHVNESGAAGQMESWWRELIDPKNPLSQITGEVRESGAHILLKSQYDAFHETTLFEILKEKRIHQVVITGVMTHLCCETTARSAFVKGFEVFFGIDTTATYNSAFHLASLLNLSHGFAIPILEKEILSTGGTGS